MFNCRHAKMYISLIITLILNILCLAYAGSSEQDCPSLHDADNMSQTQLLTRLAHGCRYDRLERPITYSEAGERLPVDVYVRAYVYFMQNLEAHDLQFKIHVLLQFRFLDPRLSFRKVSPKRKQPILGEQQLRDTLWMPHLFLANERDSSILGTSEKDILTSISPDGTVIVSSRIKATLYCWLNLKKFPFDEQHCSTLLESWMYNTSELVLHWEQKRPITFDPALHLTEFVLKQSWFNETIINADLSDLRHGAFAGNYSSLSFTMHLTRVVGFYLMDYFLPSMLIVGISWVSFWLQADQAPPRIMLGTSTMLTFITLASAQGKTLPKVSYIKVSEVWFLGCTIFIFGSLLEFAFVNSIWRRKQNLPVKKMNSKHILKSTLSPRISRRRSAARSSSFSGQRLGESISLTGLGGAGLPFNNYLTVNLPVAPKVSTITTITEGRVLDNKSISNKDTSLTNLNERSTTSTGRRFDISFVESGMGVGHSAIEQVSLNGGEYNNNNTDSKNNNDDNNDGSHVGWTTLTPQEVSIWIDRKARCVFPLAFLVFNAFFWTFVYVL